MNDAANPATVTVVGCKPCVGLGACQFGVGAITIHDSWSGAAATAICPEQYEGGPGVAHGGWIAAALDDFLGRFLTANRLVVTASLEIRYLRPVPVGNHLELTAHVVDHVGDRWTVDAQLRLEASNAALATARGVFVERDDEHFGRHQHWLATQERRRGSETR